MTHKTTAYCLSLHFCYTCKYRNERNKCGKCSVRKMCNWERRECEHNEGCDACKYKSNEKYCYSCKHGDGGDVTEEAGCGWKMSKL